MKISLQIKVIALVLLSTALLAVGTVLVSYRVYSDTMDEHYRIKAEELTNTVSDILDKEAVKQLTDDVMGIYRGFVAENNTEGLTSYSETQLAAYEPLKSTPAYQTVYRQLESVIGDNKDVVYLYLCYMDLETDKAVYLISLGHDEETGETIVDLGSAGVTDPIEAGNRAKMEKGEYDFPAYITNYDWYGWLCSAASGVPAGDGNGILADAYADISMNDVMKDRADFLTRLTLIVIITAIVLVVLINVAVHFAITKPINTLSKATGAFVSDKQEGEGESAISKLRIRTGDEIEKLTDSIQTMEKEINNYITNLTAVTAEKERIGTELSVATHIQSSMLPCIFPAFPDRTEFDIYATMDPAKEVGGDFYDFFMVDERHLAIVVADVSGKGVPAALFMVIGKTLIKDHTLPGKDLGQVFHEVNNILCGSNSEGLFITAFEGVLDLVTGEFTFVNAGHEMPCIRKAGGQYEAYKTRPGFVLAGMEDMRFRAGVMTLEPGDRLFQYTDGVTEATDANNELYGMDRMLTALNRNVTAIPGELLPAMKEDIDAFVGEAPQFDDITMLSLEFKAKMILPEENA